MKMEKKAKILVIDEAANGLDGLKQIEEHESTIDLVITDLVMPDISGVGVISIVKKKYPAVPVIAITGWGEHPEALATEAAADLVLEKPFELTELDKSVSDLLAKKSN
jgi:YesN/AraC family two-component response regulator